MHPLRRHLFPILCYTALAFFAWLMLGITLQYWPIRMDAAFLQIKQQYVGITHWEWAFFIHVFTSMAPLLAGFTQFAPGILRRRPGIHRLVGKIYILSVCFVTGPASLVMACYANGGITSRIAFTTLAILWISTTALAWSAITRRKWHEHRDWMIRSYALTLSAVTLRVWKYAIVAALAPPPMDTYRIVAWLGFVPNILIAELIIRRLHAQKTSSVAQNAPPIAQKPPSVA